MPPETIIAICAHADDAELNAGGTLAKNAAAGGQIHIIMVTDNCSGCLLNPNESNPQRLGPQETSAIRNREQQAAADLIGATMHWLDFAQRHYWDPKTQHEVEVAYAQPGRVDPIEAAKPQVLHACHQADHVRALAELIVSIHPDKVLGHSPLDLDPEHHAVASLAWSAVNLTHKMQLDYPLWFWTPGGSCPGGMLAPHYDHIEDISEFFDMKVQLCEAHASQMTPSRQKRLHEEAVNFGQQIGAAYGEPFMAARFPG